MKYSAIPWARAWAKQPTKRRKMARERTWVDFMYESYFFE
jgi:hypothetical protein